VRRADINTQFQLHKAIKLRAGQID